MARPYLQYDVFTDQPLTGNQLAVFTDSRGLDISTMQWIAREMNFPESTFILPVEWAGTDVRMRIFTPATEMPVAGHPTIGSTFALADTGVIAPGTPRFIFQLNIGPTPVDLEWTDGRLSFAWMTQPNPVFGPVAESRMLVADALSLKPDDLMPDAPIQEVSCGVPFLYVPLRDPATVDRAISDGSAFRRLAKATGIELPIFLFALDEDGGRAPARPPTAVYSRMFAPEFGITEDPATGIASGPLGAYLVHHGLVDVGPPDRLRQGSGESAKASATAEGGHHETRVDIVSRQGVAMGRPSRIHISIGVAEGTDVRHATDGPVINDVKVGGQAVLVARGEFLV
jgi:trans-2,3-dihydro-3-hydroxyanthranilate isomerase